MLSSCSAAAEGNLPESHPAQARNDHSQITARPETVVHIMAVHCLIYASIDSIDDCRMVAADRYISILRILLYPQIAAATAVAEADSIQHLGLFDGPVDHAQALTDGHR